MTFKIGIYAGRFQPFHLGHLSAVEYILDQVDCLYIIICSLKNELVTDDKNPFSFEERSMMIKNSLPSNTTDLIAIRHVRDANNDTEWTKAVVEDMPEGDAVAYSNNDFTIKAFGDHGFKTANIPIRYEKLNATLIRKHIIRGEPWKDLVPFGTWKVIQEIREKNAM